MTGLTIRARIAGGSLLIALVISIVAGIVIDSQVERIVHEGSIAVLESDSEPYVVALQDEPGERFDAPGPGQHVAVIAPDGTAQVDTLPPALSTRRTELTTARTARVTVDGTTYNVLSRPVQVDGVDWYVVAARSASEESTVLGQMRLLVISGLALVLAAVAVAAWVLTTASLAPVKRLRLSAEQLRTSSSNALLPVGPANDEIAELARTLNDLVGRLRASTDRERQLVSDASHELRTPLAILSTRLQLASAEATSVDEVRADVEAARRDVARLSSLVTSLLELSAIEARDPANDLDRLHTSTAAELEQEAIEAADRARFRATGPDIEVEYDGLGDARADTRAGVHTDPGADARDTSGRFAIRAEDFGRVVDNLANNALRALGESGALRIGLERSATGIRLTVADTGGGLDPAFVAHAFDRFSRADAARSDGSGAGLGLPIVDAIVRNAGGGIHLDNAPGVGLRVIVDLPALRPGLVE
jgi:two-component system, OmpR family, sensor kinase